MMSQNNFKVGEMGKQYSGFNVSAFYRKYGRIFFILHFAFRSNRFGSKAISESYWNSAQPYRGSGERGAYFEIYETHEESGDTLQEVCIGHT